MGFLIAGLLVMNLAVTLVCGQLLERNFRRYWYEIQNLLDETKWSLGEVNSSMAVLTHTVTAQGDRRGRERSEDAAVFDKFQISICSALSEMGDGNMAALRGIEEHLRALEELLDMSRMETLQKKPPVSIAEDKEAKRSQAIEEGIENLLQYQVGKGREQL